jgi:hypothetical protein
MLGRPLVFLQISEYINALKPAFMHLKKYNLLFAILFISVCFCACQSEETEKKADFKDSITTGNGAGGAKKATDFSSADSTTKQAPATTDRTVSTANNNAQKNKALIKAADDKTKNAATTAVKKATVVHDTATAVTATTPAKNNAPVVADNTKIQSADANAADKPFVYKYGIIPWNAREDNITSFKDAFPDKQTNVRINFDNDPDGAMQSEKALVMGALKKAGYTNVNEQSKTFHPARIPKEIHYELQHDGTVVIWVPPVVNGN